MYALQTRTGALLWQSKLSVSTTFPLTVSDGCIYISTQNACMAFESKDGSLLWQSKVEGTCRSEPIVVNGKVIISLSVFKFARSSTSSKKVRQWQDTFLCALQASDGSPCWQQPLRTDRGESDSVTSNSPDKSANEPGSPLGGDPTVPYVMGNVIYVGVGGTLRAFQLDTGTHLWDYHTEGTFLSSPRANDDVVYVGSDDGYVYALQTNNGTSLWRTYLG